MGHSGKDDHETKIMHKSEENVVTFFDYQLVSDKLSP